MHRMQIIIRRFYRDAGRKGGKGGKGKDKDGIGDKGKGVKGKGGTDGPSLMKGKIGKGRVILIFASSLLHI